MTKISNSKIFKLCKNLTLISSLSLLALYQTDYLDDIRYLLGGMYRGLRCAKIGTQIAYTYIYVKI
jgi:hypothetical protein